MDHRDSSSSAAGSDGKIEGSQAASIDFPGKTDHQQIVATSRSHLERPLGTLLPFDIG
jgi:hypothetical protein